MQPQNLPLDSEGIDYAITDNLAMFHGKQPSNLDSIESSFRSATTHGNCQWGCVFMNSNTNPGTTGDDFGDLLAGKPSQFTQATLIANAHQRQNDFEGALRTKEIHVVALCDLYKPNLELAQKLAPQAKVSTDCRDLIAANDIDAVCIASPDHWHAFMTIEACKAGKDVYVEKPVGVTVYEGQMMVKAARKYNRIVQVGTQQRSGDHYQQAYDYIRGGKLGKISFVRSWNYVNSTPDGIGNPPDSDPPAGFDWDRWLGPAPYHKFNRNRLGINTDNFSYFRWFWDYAGGMMTDLGVHSLDIVLWAMNVKGPTVASALGGNYVSHDNRETPDTFMATFEFPGFICDYEYRDGNAQM